MLIVKHLGTVVDYKEIRLFSKETITVTLNSIACNIFQSDGSKGLVDLNVSGSYHSGDKSDHSEVESSTSTIEHS